MKSLIFNLVTALAFALPGFAADKHEAKAGPNGGRVISAVEPHLEFFVTKERKVEITALDEALKPAKFTGQVIAVTAGERSKPTKLEFKEEGGKLVSSNTLPEGNDYPVSVSIKPAASGKAVYEKFNLNLEKCPTCKFQEYACICEHAKEEKDDKKK
ncbi:MAG: hypothetical protein JWL90_2668 [Chthoniobacteraceae bacterium]|nr:hypothetical protein [Chthoniobacteraceae bacterium]